MPTLYRIEDDTSRIMARAKAERLRTWYAGSEPRPGGPARYYRITCRGACKAGRPWHAVEVTPVAAYCDCPARVPCKHLGAVLRRRDFAWPAVLMSIWRSCATPAARDSVAGYEA